MLLEADTLFQSVVQSNGFKGASQLILFNDVHPIKALSTFKTPMGITIERSEEQFSKAL